MSSKDPEDALFNLFPSALGYHSLSIKEDEEVLNSFTNHIQEAILEIRSAYDELINRIEKVIIGSLYCSSSKFEIYKDEIQSKIGDINPLTLGKVQSVFYKRLTSPLDDRVSWVKSVADVALGKGLEEMLDEEEPLLITTIKDLSLGLIKAAEISDFNKNSKQGTLYSFRFFGESGEFVDDKFVINTKASKEFTSMKKEISETISKLDDAKRKELLVELLSKEMKI
jgi:hypothetical protein